MPQSWLISFTLIATTGAAFAADNPAEEKLALSKETFHKAVTDARQGILGYLDGRETMARDKGDKAGVDRLKAERDAFEVKGVLPKSCPQSLQQKLNTAKRDMETAYRDAVRDLLKSRNDDRAAAVDKEFKDFQSAGIAAYLRKSENWTPLFNGKDLTGWEEPTDTLQAKWTVEDGVLVGRGPRGYLYTKRGDFGDFRLRTEVRIGEGSNGGIFFRSPQGIATPRTGYEVDLASHSHDGISQSGGIIVYAVEAKRRSNSLLENKTHAEGAWFTLELEAKGNRFTVQIDGKTVNEFTEAGNYFPKGHIGIQHYVPDRTIEIRKLEILELPGT